MALFYSPSLEGEHKVRGPPLNEEQAQGIHVPALSSVNYGRTQGPWASSILVQLGATAKFFQRRRSPRRRIKEGERVVGLGAWPYSSTRAMNLHGRHAALADVKPLNPKQKVIMNLSSISLLLFEGNNAGASPLFLWGVPSILFGRGEITIMKWG